MDTEWASLPELVFNLILQKIQYFPDCIRFASVCTTWRSQAKHADAKLIAHPMSLIPTFNTGPRSRKRRRATRRSHDLQSTFIDATTLLYSVGENKTYRIKFPFSRHSPITRLCGSSHGWLIMLHKDCSITLFKPTPKQKQATNNTIRLPPIVAWSINPIITLSADPSTCDHYTVVAIYASKHNMSMFTSGDENWTLHNLQFKDMGTLLFCSTMWHRERLYAVTHSGKIVHIDDVLSKNPRLITVYDKKREVDDELGWSVYLAESSRGELLMIRKYSKFDYRVYKLEVNEDGVYDKVEVLGGDAFFLGYHSSVVAVEASGTCRKNCIFDTSELGNTLNIFSLENAKCQTHNFDANYPAWTTFWFMPLLLDDWI